MIILDKDFKLKFKKIAFENNGILLTELCKIIELPEDHYTHSVLNRYFIKYPKVFLDKEMARKIMTLHFDNGIFYIVDYNEPFQGGYPNRAFQNFKLDVLPNDLKINEIINSNWHEFVEHSKLLYWKNDENLNRYLSLGIYNLFEERQPKNAREKYLSSGQELIIDGIVRKIKYNFFNVKNVEAYYIELIKEFFPEFKLIKEVSNNKIKRFAKEIEVGSYLALYVNFGFLINELEKTYLELPQIKIEVFNSGLNECINEDLYLINPGEFPIVRINFSYFIGNPIDSRIGNSSENEENLKKNLFYYFDIYSYYLSLYLKTVEKSLGQTILTQSV